VISKADIKHIRSLRRKKFRDQHQLFIVEGHKMLNAAITHRPELIKVIYTTSPEAFEAASDHEIISISSKTMDQISSLRSPQSVITICKKPRPRAVNAPLILALDTIQDPGNMGTILRLAAWFGIDDIVASEGCADIYNPKVVQASMGAIFTINTVVHELNNYLAEINQPIFGAVLEGENIYKQDLPTSGVILMGNEGNGINEALLPLISHPISIPKIGVGESLNVAMATGIVLSEFRRATLED